MSARFEAAPRRTAGDCLRAAAHQIEMALALLDLSTAPPCAACGHTDHYTNPTHAAANRALRDQPEKLRRHAAEIDRAPVLAPSPEIPE